jgi:hypothetical protein
LAATSIIVPMKNAKVIRRPFPGVTVLNHPVRRKRNVLAGSDQHDNPRALPPRFQSGHSNVVCFDQTHPVALRYERAGDSQGDRGRGAMFTSVECQSQAGEKLAQAELDERNRRRLITAAQAWIYLARQWIYLARQMRRVEASSTNGEVVTKRRSKSRMKAKAAT